MRDPDRIPIILDVIRDIWEQNPDLRLGQLILNLRTTGTAGLYYVEDDVLITRLKELYGVD